ncbi:MAG TPA: DNRLRE domain-containing protein [bacterium]|nr:DNRLRE domain-containing protein [bacterium]
MKRTLALLVVLAVAVQANPTAWQADADAHVINQSPDENFGSLDEIAVRYDEHTEYRSFIHFDLPDPHGDDEVMEGVLELNVDTYHSPGIIGIYLLSEDWDELSVTWNDQPTYDTEKMLFQDWVYYYGYWIELTLDGSVLTEWFQEEPFNNYGMIMIADPDMSWPNIFFKSRETSSEPLLWLYPDPWPVESVSWGVIKANDW